MASTTSLDRIGVGIDTARYGHRVSFLRPDRKPAAKPITVMEYPFTKWDCQNQAALALAFITGRREGAA